MKSDISEIKTGANLFLSYRFAPVLYRYPLSTVYLPSLESIKELQTEYTNMLTAIIDLLDGAKYLWEGDHHK